MASTNTPDQDARPPVVVAISASAAKTGSSERLLERLPSREDAALVIVLQQREALDEERLRAALARAAHALVEPTDGTPVEAGRLYLPDLGVIATLEDGCFLVRPTTQIPSEQGAIDRFLVALAKDAGDRCLVVTLDGSDGDGTLGVKKIKAAGGLAVAEETPESRAGELAQSDSPAALADAVLPLGELAPRVTSLLDELVGAPEDAPTAAPSAPATRSPPSPRSCGSGRGTISTATSPALIFPRFGGRGFSSPSARPVRA